MVEGISDENENEEGEDGEEKKIDFLKRFFF